MNTFQLKILALISMVIDHIGAVFFPDIMILRFIGRISFPIYAFLLVQGYLHTSNNSKRIKKYAERLILFAILSEISFDLCFYNQPIWPGYQNIFFTLFIGLIAMYLYEYIESKGKDGFYVIIAACLIAFLIHSDYNVIGIIVIFTFFFMEKSKKEHKETKVQKVLFYLTFFIISLIEILLNSYDITFESILLTFKEYSWAYLGVPLCLIPIGMYNGQLGHKSKLTQSIFYWAYPVHITLIYIINYIITSKM